MCIIRAWVCGWWCTCREACVRFLCWIERQGDGLDTPKRTDFTPSPCTPLLAHYLDLKSVSFVLR